MMIAIISIGVFLFGVLIGLFLSCLCIAAGRGQNNNTGHFKKE
jgi:hypothetical protein